MRMRGVSLTLVVVIGGVAAAWEFPRLALSPGNDQRPFSLDDDDGDVDIVTGSQFSGLKTFANLPYVNCFSDEEAENKKYDIAILGAPFDTVSVPSRKRRMAPSLWTHMTDVDLCRWPIVRHRETGGSVRTDRDQDRQPEDIPGGSLECLHRFESPSLPPQNTVPGPGRTRRECPQLLGDHCRLRRRAPDLAGQQRCLQAAGQVAQGFLPRHPHSRS